MRKRILAGIMALLCVVSSTTVYAAPEMKPDGTVFDAEYYAETYPDLKAAFGNDANALYNHYVMFGRAEGRQPAAENAVTAEIPATVVQKTDVHPGVQKGFYSYADNHRVVSADGILELCLDDLTWSTEHSYFPAPKIYYAEDGLLTIEAYYEQQIHFHFKVIIDGEYTTSLENTFYSFYDSFEHVLNGIGQTADQLSIGGQFVNGGLFGKVSIDRPMISLPRGVVEVNIGEPKIFYIKLCNPYDRGRLPRGIFPDEVDQFPIRLITLGDSMSYPGSPYKTKNYDMPDEPLSGIPISFPSK